MDIKNSIPLIFLFLLCVFRIPAQKPNIIFIMADDLGWYDVGFNGNYEIKTPNLDQMASKGIILDRFYSASAVCSPTRGSALTGRNPFRLGIPHANSGHLKPEEITLPELLKKVGYATAHFGKWHLGTLTRTRPDANRGGREAFFEHFSIPSQHGYDQYFCTESKVPTYDPMVFPEKFEKGESKRYGWDAVDQEEASKAYGTAYWRGKEERDTSNLKGDDSRVIMDRVIPFVRHAANKPEPFFATIWFHTPHLPVVADSLHRSYYSDLEWEKQIYYGTITAMDEQIGRLWKELEALGIEKQTIIWFCSDNGPENGTPGSAGIFRERKRSLYEGGVRVPAFVCWEGQFKGCKTMDFPAVTSDYLPTILDILNIKYPDERPLDGESLLGVLKGKGRKRKKPIGFIIGKQISWVGQRYKLISQDKGKSFELYDLKKDPGEHINIIEKKGRKAKRMKKELFEWRKSLEKSKNGLDYN